MEISLKSIFIFWCYQGITGEYSNSCDILLLRNVGANKREKEEERYEDWF